MIFPGSVREQRTHHIRVRRLLARINESELCGFFRQLPVIHQVAVVPQSHVNAIRAHAEHRLGIFPTRSTSGGITSVADSHMPLQRFQRLLIKDLADKPQILEHQYLITITHGDACGFLATVLQCVETVVGQF